LVRCCCGCPVGLPPGGAHICQHHPAMSHLRNTARLTAGLLFPRSVCHNLLFYFRFSFPNLTSLCKTSLLQALLRWR
jgi:hypothetical protein